jgi:hypothetical protein
MSTRFKNIALCEIFSIVAVGAFGNARMINSDCIKIDQCSILLHLRKKAAGINLPAALLYFAKKA